MLRSPRWVLSATRGQPGLFGAVSVHYVNPHVVVPLGAEDDLRPVEGPVRVNVIDRSLVKRTWLVLSAIITYIPEFPSR